MERKMILSEEQHFAARHTEGPCLVLAVPGAGKTTVILHRAKFLIEEAGVDPKNILSVTFSKAQASDMERRFKTFNKPYPVRFSTIHSLAFGVIKDYAKKLGVNYRLIESPKNPINKYSIIREIVKKQSGEFLNDDLSESLFGGIGFVKNAMISPDEFPNSFERVKFSEVFYEYERIKRENDYIDFDDMLSLTLEAFEKTDILDSYRSRYPFIQMDEGQDSSVIQVKIIQMLSSPLNNLFVVADDDQAIYGFRGADPSWLLGFKNSYPNAKFYFIEENYRSQKNIVNQLNGFIVRNKSRYKKTIHTKKSVASPIVAVKPRDMESQYRYIVNEIKKNPMQTAILYRNNLSAIGLVNAFEREKIPFGIRDLKLKFFDHRMLRDIKAFFAFARDPKDFNAFEKIFFKMKGYISRKQMNFAKNHSANLPVLDRIMDFPNLPAFYREGISELKYDFKKLTRLSPNIAIEWIEYQLDYERYLKENAQNYELSFHSLKHALYFLKSIAQKTETVEDFYDRLELLKNLCANSLYNKAEVILSTIHASKGLEFERVFIVDLFEGILPNSGAIEENLKKNNLPLEEERRLFYVAMSRAKSHLCLISPKSLENEEIESSSFLKELIDNSVS